MAGLGRTIKGLSKNRRDWSKLLQSGALPGTGASTQGGHLRETEEFGPNPGRLRMLSYVPEQLSEQPALVVVLHGCTQTAAGYDEGTGWSLLAKHYGFAVLFPEQQRANNPNTCFNWFLTGDTERDQGEALSIRSMVERMIVDHGLDRRRVFVTGLSAGGAMTSVMLATYPDVFSGGAIIAGLPYRCATDIPEAFQSMSQGRTHPAREWGDLVRSASHHKGPWPKVSVWHGSADTTVTPMNAGEIIKQWLNVHEVLPKSFSTDEIDGYPHRIWHDASGEAVLEEYIITGMAHGTPLATADNENNYGATGPYLLEAGISSSYHIATFWGLTDSRLTDEQLSAEDQLSGEDSEDVVFTPQASPSGPSSMEDNLLTFGKPESASRPGSKSFDVQGVIEKALKTAGLMK